MSSVLVKNCVLDFLDKDLLTIAGCNKEKEQLLISKLRMIELDLKLIDTSSNNENHINFFLSSFRNHFYRSLKHVSKMFKESVAMDERSKNLFYEDIEDALDALKSEIRTLAELKNQMISVQFENSL